MKREFAISIVVFLALLVGLNGLFDYKLPYLGAVTLYVGIHFVVSLATREKRRAAISQTPGAAVPDWPTSGPIGRLGQKGLVAAFTVSGLLCLLNPFQVVQFVRQALGNARLRAKPAGPAESALTYALPFDGEWFVYNGGVTREDSHSWDVLTQRYAYDFVVVDRELKRHDGRGTRRAEYFCHGRAIRAAASGVVVAVEDRIGEAPFVGYGIVDFCARSFVGNHVVIRHAASEYGFYAHLLAGQVSVRVGDTVERGQVIGRCGHSGHSSEPHLHFHVQAGADFFTSAGVPVRFAGVLVDGQPAAVGACLRLGQRVASIEEQHGSAR
ncbi:MAG TPA: M23 family peptidase [Nitrospira sp.]|nr:M23 family peptidase [Nitrospira sp.]HRJ46474.1 M23 family metallopeptidase [Opitutaceae bacterium]